MISKSIKRFVKRIYLLFWLPSEFLPILLVGFDWHFGLLRLISRYFVVLLMFFDLNGVFFCVRVHVLRVGLLIYIGLFI